MMYQSPQQEKKQFFSRKNIFSLILVAATVVSGALIYFGRDNFRTFLGEVGIPSVGNGATLKQWPANVTWLGSISQSIDLTINVSLTTPTSIPLSSAESVIHFDPAFITVKGTPKITSMFQHAVRADVDNAAGVITLSAGQPYPGVHSGKAQGLFASFDIAFKKTGDTSLTFDYGNGRGSGTSHVVLTDNDGKPVDILDHVENLPIQILSPVPVINTVEKYNGIIPRTIVTKNSSDRIPVILNGRGFDETTKIVYKCFYGTSPTWTLDPTRISPDGTSVLFYVPQNSDGLNAMLGSGCPNTGTLYPSVVGVQTQYGTAWYRSDSGSNAQLTYIAPSTTFDPSISGSNPAVLAPGGQITITGNNFQFYAGRGPTPVQLVNEDAIIPLENIVVTPPNTARTANQLTATIPASTPEGVYDIQLVQNMSGGTIPDKEAVLLRGVTVTDAPQITSVSPSEVTKDFTSNLHLQVSGDNFGIDKTKVQATLQGPQTVALAVSDLAGDGTSASLVIPSVLSEGQYTLSLTANGITQTKEGALKVTAPLKPLITSVSPNRFEVGYTSGTRVTLSGSNLAQTKTCALQSSSGTSYNLAFNVDAATSESTVSATLPDSLPIDTYSFVLTIANDESVNFDNALTVTEMIPTPALTSLNPSTVNTGYQGGTSVKITGSHFGVSPRVEFSGSAAYAPIITQHSDTELTVTLPANMLVGKYRVSVTTLGKTGSMENGIEIIQPNPVITSVAPSTFEVGYVDQTPITIAGEYFRTDSQVKLVGTTTYNLANPHVSEDAKTIVAHLPAGIQPGEYKLVVYAGASDPMVTASVTFIVTQKPQKVLAPTVTNTSNAKFSTQLSATWTLPTGSPAPQSYQYRILDNGNEIRGWDAGKIGLDASVTAKGLTLMNGHAYVIEVRGVNAAGPGDSGKSGALTTRSANLDFDSNEKVGLNDLYILGKSTGRTDRPMADINQSGLVSFDDLGILLSLWNP